MESARDERLTRPADLAEWPDFLLGPTQVFPGRRAIVGPGGSTTVEPRVMQVLVVLAQAEGAVVTRETIERRCWGGHVGDDSLNRAVAMIRRIARTECAGSFQVETIPRTGYRLTRTAGAARVVQADGAVPRAEVEDDSAAAPTPGFPSRRQLLVTGAATAAVAAVGAAGWVLHRHQAPDPRVLALVRQGQDAWRLAAPDAMMRAAVGLRQAVALAPDDPAVHGWLALLLRYAAEYAAPEETGAWVSECTQAARLALDLDPNEGNAHAALASLPPIYGDWFGMRGRLLHALKVAPGNLAATLDLAILEAATGRWQAAVPALESLLEREPLAATVLFRRVFHLWTLGRISEMDQVADRALQLWPHHVAVWYARLITLAYTGRAAAALRMVEDTGSRPKISAPAVELQRTTMRALASGTTADTAAAVAANRAASARGPSQAVISINNLCALGAVDDAFDAVEGYLLHRGPLTVPLLHNNATPSMTDLHRRKTQMLFVPVSAPIRADPRFPRLMEDIGLADYWRRTGLGPSHLDGRAPAPI